jgi:hypothetical protein
MTELEELQACLSGVAPKVVSQGDYYIMITYDLGERIERLLHELAALRSGSETIIPRAIKNDP